MDTFGLHFIVLVIIVLYISCHKLKSILYKLLHEGHRIGVSNELEGSNHDDILSVISRSSIKVSIFYGSQTGTAKKFAIDLGHHLHDSGIRNLVIDLRYLSMDILVNLSMLDTCVSLFVVATYGEGEPTDNSRSFMDDVENSSQNLNNLHFAVFGMGNSMYTYFNAFGKSVDRLLSKHGAKRLLSLTLGDEVNELEPTFINWKNLVTSALIDFFNLSNNNENYFNEQYKRIYSLKYVNWSLPLVSYYTNMLINKAHVKEMLPYGTDNYFYVPVIANEELNHESSRSCRYIELDLSTSQLRYKTGDHVAIFPPNPSYLVETIGVLLKINLNKMISLDAIDTYSLVKHPFPCPCTYRHAFMYFVDITGPPGRSLFSACLSFIGNPEELRFVQLLVSDSEEGKKLYSRWILEDHRGLIDVLHDLESFRPPADLLLELLNPLKPRLYSISSSSLVHPNRLHITASVVRYETNSAGKNGQMVLFFGCRHENEDFIYSHELKQACATGLLKMFTAFSRDSPDGNKVYVQHKLLEMGSMVWELLDELYAYIYVCGNAAGMARDVHSCLIDLVVKHSKVTTEAAVSYILNLRRQGRYRMDVWK